MSFEILCKFLVQVIVIIMILSCFDAKYIYIVGSQIVAQTQKK